METAARSAHLAALTVVDDDEYSYAEEMSILSWNSSTNNESSSVVAEEAGSGNETIEDLFALCLQCGDAASASNALPLFQSTFHAYSKTLMLLDHCLNVIGELDHDVLADTISSGRQWRSRKPDSDDDATTVEVEFEEEENAKMIEIINDTLSVEYVASERNIEII